jgi:G3E family GTPase
MLRLNKIQLAQIFTIVDALNFIRSVQMLNRTRHQVMIADTILINKIDQEHVDLGAVHSMVKNINPFATILETSYCKLDLDEYILQDALNHYGAM